MTGSGFRRHVVSGVLLRLVEDRRRAYDDLLRRGWGHLPSPFFDWLLTGEPGTTYLLRAFVHRPELWVHANVGQQSATEAEPLSDLIGAMA